MTNESSRFRRFGERGPMRTEIIDLKWCFSLRRNSSKEALYPNIKEAVMLHIKIFSILQ